MTEDRQKETRKIQPKAGPARPPSSSVSPSTSSPPSSLGSLLTLVPLRKSKTASIDLSFHSCLTDWAFECFHSHAFPIAFGLGSPCSGLYKKMAAGLLLSSPAQPAPATTGLLELYKPKSEPPSHTSSLSSLARKSEPHSHTSLCCPHVRVRHLHRRLHYRSCHCTSRHNTSWSHS